MSTKSLAEANSRITKLREEGFRITKVRRAILEIFAAHAHPLSALELIATLKERDLPVNKTTVYRELDFLLENKVISELDLLDGMKRYELLHAGHHHHHIVCTRCKKIQCIEMNNDLDDLERSIQRRYRFKVSAHVLEFFGICSVCAPQ